MLSLYFGQVLESVGVSQVLVKVTNLYQQLRLTKIEAEIAFIETASSPDAPHNVHLYRLRRKKQEPTSQVTLAMGDDGISIYEVSAQHSLTRIAPGNLFR